ncbi:PE-PGRS family protein PE_PGRS45-like [Pocillopora verrucosa]|uniref:PE-PGRS family protein PE_PGRS45-like n=1 Tax=Pocillopora verrucosa TaxID=203993 RepID=UPI00333F541B
MFTVFNYFILAVLFSQILEGRGNCRNLKFTNFRKSDYRLENHTVRTIEVADEGLCMLQCYLEPNCVSYNFCTIKQASGKHKCDLNSATIEHDEDLVKYESCIYREAENACAKNSCKNNATCQAGFTDRDYQCLCALGSGFEGHNCDEDIDECTNGTHKCDMNADCHNTPGSYKCTCKDGFQGNGTDCTQRFNTAVFTNLGKIDSQGPDSVGSHYTGQDHNGQVTVSSGIQLWNVPHTGEYRIEAVGASGGYGQNSVINGGRGARMIGNFMLTKDEIISILVGQKGIRGGVNKNTGGGGGGTFVVRGNNIPLIIAGGGGGIKNMSEQHPGCDASINTTGNAGSNSPLGSGGSNGHGGNANGQSPGGGGGGFYGNGQGASSGTGRGGKGYLQGGRGGHARGGFGGGGGFRSGNRGAGGGGGYSGGNGAADEQFSCGGGGGSFNNGTNQQNECCLNSNKHGRVIITFLQ